MDKANKSLFLRKIIKYAALNIQICKFSSLEEGCTFWPLIRRGQNIL
jgi:hypothetical protein